MTHDIDLSSIDQDLQKAAVLIPFIKHEKNWHLLFIRRASNEFDFHSGQVAFAGGKHESHDQDLYQTALREAHEEIGINPLDVAILGKLNFHHSITHFQITPVIGLIPWPYTLSLDEREVARAFTIPLDWLADPNNHRIEQRRLTQEKSYPVVYFKEYDNELLWGATARMTLSLISLLTCST